MNTSSFLVTARRFAALTAATAPLLLGACANQAVTQSGFLVDYDKLFASQKDAKSLSYSRAAGANSAAARLVVVIDPIDMRLPVAQTADLAPELVRQAKADFRVALEKAFSKSYQVVGQAPAEGALRVRAAITGLKPSNPALNAATFLLLGPVSNGGVSTEAEVVDSATGERVAARATYTNGHLFDGGLGGYFDKLGHIRKAFDSHAEKLRELTFADATAANATAAAATPQIVNR
ncbi:MAG: DUF3313 domain-containing protein [Chitinophagaceae bacterium]|nr:DUF3313 domain-containing protein [Rubrivivax sp.]